MDQLNSVDDEDEINWMEYLRLEKQKIFLLLRMKDTERKRKHREKKVVMPEIYEEVQVEEPVVIYEEYSSPDHNLEEYVYISK